MLVKRRKVEGTMKIHVLFKKEEIDAAQMKDDKIAIVFDILLATSTITACLEAGARQVIPVLDVAEAKVVAERFNSIDICLAGEDRGLSIPGFMDPTPLYLKEKVSDKTVVLLTTNGTIAIRKSADAHHVYISSLLNVPAVVEQVRKVHKNETIVLVCSGSQNQFCFEDFYGAGYFVSEMAKQYGEIELDMSDHALAAMVLYESAATGTTELMKQTRVGKMLTTYDYQEDLAYISQQGISTVIPKLINGTIIRT